MFLDLTSDDEGALGKSKAGAKASGFGGVAKGARRAGGRKGEGGARPWGMGRRQMGLLGRRGDSVGLARRRRDGEAVRRVLLWR